MMTMMTMMMMMMVVVMMRSWWWWWDDDDCKGTSGLDGTCLKHVYLDNSSQICAYLTWPVPFLQKSNAKRDTPQWPRGLWMEPPRSRSVPRARQSSPYSTSCVQHSHRWVPKSPRSENRQLPGMNRMPSSNTPSGGWHENPPVMTSQLINGSNKLMLTWKCLSPIK